MPGIGERKPEGVSMTIRKHLNSLVLIFSLVACNGDDDSNRSLYEMLNMVDIGIDLNSPEYQVLRQNNAFVYLEGGRRGIIVLNKGANQYKAFERNCPFQPNNDCATVSMHPSVTFMVDSCCSSQFDLNGQVQSPPSTLPMVEYTTFLLGSELRIQFP